MKTKISYMRTFSTDWNTKKADSGHLRIFCGRFVEYFRSKKLIDYSFNSWVYRQHSNFPTCIVSFFPKDFPLKAIFFPIPNWLELTFIWKYEVHSNKYAKNTI